MATVRNRGNKLYISYYDPSVGRGRDKSTGLDNNRENMKKAKLIAKLFQEELDKQTEENKELGIERITIQTAYDKFKIMNRDKSKKTIYEYDWFFKRFSESFSSNSPCAIINKLSCEEWLMDLRSLPYAQNTLHVYSKVLKKFLAFLFEYNYLPNFTINRNCLIRQEVKPIITFSKSDIATFFENLSVKNTNFKTTMNLLFYTGLRPSDIYKIKVEDIDFEQNQLKYYSTKTKEHFIVPFHKDLRSILKQRCQEVKAGNLLHYANINNIGKAFRRYLKSINLNDKNYNLRTFRKSFITCAHDSGTDLATVSKLVGHSNITTTAKYYNKLSVRKKAEELNKIKLSFNQNTNIEKPRK